MKAKPELITSDYTPSEHFIEWCVAMGITSSTLEKEKPEFILWHQTKGIRRSNFDLAFKNWIKKSLEFSKRQEDTIKKGSQSFSDYKPLPVVDKNKTAGREALDKLLGRKK